MTRHLVSYAVDAYLKKYIDAKKKLYLALETHLTNATRAIYIINTFK